MQQGPEAGASNSCVLLLPYPALRSQILNVSGNRLRSLPADLGWLSLKQLSLVDNVDLHIPIHVLQKGFRWAPLVVKPPWTHPRPGSSSHMRSQLIKGACPSLNCMLPVFQSWDKGMSEAHNRLCSSRQTVKQVVSSRILT